MLVKGVVRDRRIAAWVECLRAAEAVSVWMQIDFSRPGNPTGNSFIETFNGPFRDECLNLHGFESLAEANREIEAWRQDDNETRHQTLT